MTSWVPNLTKKKNRFIINKSLLLLYSIATYTFTTDFFETEQYSLKLYITNWFSQNPRTHVFLPVRNPFQTLTVFPSRNLWKCAYASWGALRYSLLMTGERCVVGWHWPAPTKVSLSVLSTAGQGEKIWWFLDWDKDWERSLTKYHHRKNRLKFGILTEFITNKIRAG